MIDPWGLSALAGALPLGGGLAAADGPLPVGDIIGGGIILGAGIYDAYQAWQYWNENDEGGGEQCEVPTTPPDGLVENPHRPDSWGEIGPDGKFKEKWRRDKGRPEVKSGHGSQDHIHVGDRWYPIKKK